MSATCNGGNKGLILKRRQSDEAWGIGGGRNARADWEYRNCIETLFSRTKSPNRTAQSGELINGGERELQLRQVCVKGRCRCRHGPWASRKASMISRLVDVLNARRQSLSKTRRSPQNVNNKFQLASQQNRRQKVVNRGFYVCAGGVWH